MNQSEKSIYSNSDSSLFFSFFFSRFGLILPNSGNVRFGANMPTENCNFKLLRWIYTKWKFVFLSNLRTFCVAKYSFLSMFFVCLLYVLILRCVYDCLTFWYYTEIPCCSHFAQVAHYVIHWNANARTYPRSTFSRCFWQIKYTNHYLVCGERRQVYLSFKKNCSVHHFEFLWNSANANKLNGNHVGAVAHQNW